MNLDLYVRCFDSLMSRGPSRGPNIFYVRTTSEPKVRLLQRKTDFSTLVIYYWPFQGEVSMLVRFLVFNLLFNLFRIALWPIVGKELSLSLFTCAFFYFSAVLTVDVPFPVWCLWQDVEFDCIGSWSLPFYLLFTLLKDDVHPGHSSWTIQCLRLHILLWITLE